MPHQPYPPEYYQKLRDSAYRSAAQVVPFIIDLLEPGSVIDVGCGIGTWLSVFKNQSIVDIQGVDGNHIDRNLIEIPAHQFRASDFTKPLHLDRTFDLAICLEVAEHIASSQAAVLVDSLARLSTAILFSAATPNQGGDHHLNEQFPKHWCERLEPKGYVGLDILRRTFWNDEDVDWWYSQNMLLFVHTERIQNQPLKMQPLQKQSSPRSIVHPKKYHEEIWKRRRWQGLFEIRRFLCLGTSFGVIEDGTIGGKNEFGPDAIEIMEGRITLEIKCPHRLEYLRHVERVDGGSDF